MKKSTIGTIASVGAVLLIGAGTLVGINAAQGGFTPEPSLTPASIVEESTTPTPTPTPTVTPTPEPAPVVEAPPAPPEPEPAPVEPTYCPEGTVAGAVDEYGNESACYETDDGGQPCVEYDANNNCTAYYKP